MSTKIPEANNEPEDLFDEEVEDRLEHEMSSYSFMCTSCKAGRHYHCFKSRHRHTKKHGFILIFCKCDCWLEGPERE